MERLFTRRLHKYANELCERTNPVCVIISLAAALSPPSTRSYFNNDAAHCHSRAVRVRRVSPLLCQICRRS